MWRSLLELRVAAAGQRRGRGRATGSLRDVGLAVRKIPVGPQKPPTQVVYFETVAAYGEAGQVDPLASLKEDAGEAQYQIVRLRDRLQLDIQRLRDIERALLDVRDRVNELSGFRSALRYRIHANAEDAAKPDSETIQHVADAAGSLSPLKKLEVGAELKEKALALMEGHNLELEEAMERLDGTSASPYAVATGAIDECRKKAQQIGRYVGEEEAFRELTDAQFISLYMESQDPKRMDRDDMRRTRFLTLHGQSRAASCFEDFVGGYLTLIDLRSGPRSNYGEENGNGVPRTIEVGWPLDAGYSKEGEDPQFYLRVGTMEQRDAAAFPCQESPKPWWYQH